MIVKIIAYETEFDMDQNNEYSSETFFHEDIDPMCEGFADFLGSIGLLAQDEET